MNFFEGKFGKLSLEGTLYHVVTVSLCHFISG